MGQVALAWLHAQGEDVFPIPGTKRVHRLEENMAGFNVELADEEKKQLEDIADKVKGARYPDDLMAFSFGEVKKQTAAQLQAGLY